MVMHMDRNQLPIPIELPVVDIVLQLIAPDVEYGQVNDLSQFLWKRDKPVSIQEYRRELV